MPVLLGMSIDYRGKTLHLDEDTITIGRSNQNIISLNNASISTNHCILTKKNDVYLLKDLQSTNGTRVNGQLISETVLQNQDVIHFGALEFIFAEQRSEAIDQEQFVTQIIPPTTIEVSNVPMERPASFSSVSPYGLQRKDNKRTLHILISIIGALALMCVGLLFYILFTDG